MPGFQPAIAVPVLHDTPAAEPAAPVEPATPSTPAPAPGADAPDATPLADAPEPTAPAEPSESPAAVPAASADGCTAAGLSSTINSVTGALSKYFEKNPDVNAALLDATRQPAFVAVGQMDSYFNEHPTEANAIRGIQAPLNAFKDRCGLQVSPTDALAALASL